MTTPLRTRNKWWGRALWLVGGLLALWMLAWAAVPSLVKSQAEKIGSEKLGRQLRVGQVGFHPWTMALTLDDVSIAGAQGSSAPMLQVKRIAVDAALWQSLRQWAPVVDAITIDEPMVRVTHLGQGRYDFDDIVAHLAAGPKTAPAPTPSFALYNISLNKGAVDFNDPPVGRTHTLRDLQLALPFISNLDSQREIKTAPHLAFNINGSSFDSAAQSTPFAASRKTDASIQLKGLDLAPYLPYLPASLPVKLLGAVVETDLKLAFEETPKTSLRLSGMVQVDKIKLANPQGENWLDMERLKLTLNDVRPLEQSVHLSAVELDSPVVDVRRDAAGGINLLAAPSASKPIANNVHTTSEKDIKDSKQGGWKVTLDKLLLRSGHVRWSDAQTQPTAQAALHDVQLQASAIAWPFTHPMQWAGSAQLDDGTAASPSALLSFSGTATDSQAQVDAKLGGLPLALAAPYLAGILRPRLEGQLQADVHIDWAAPQALKITAKQLTMDKLALVEATTAPASQSASKGKPKPGSTPKNAASLPSTQTLASLRQLQLGQAQVDLVQRRVNIGSLSLSEPRTKVQRGADQRWMFERWLVAPSATTTTTTDKANPAHRDVAPDKPAPPWSISVADLRLDGGSLGYLDESGRVPVALDLSALTLQMKDLTPGSPKASALTLSARVAAAGNAQPGQLKYQGTLALEPLATSGALDVARLPLHALEPYFGAALNVVIQRADTSFKGQLAYSAIPLGPALQVRGDGMLEDFRANLAATGGPAALGTVDTAAGDELLSWKLLNLAGVDLALQPGSATRVSVKETALSDFYARIVVGEDGRINLQDLVKASPPAAPGMASPAAAVAASGAAPTASNSIASSAINTGVKGQTNTPTSADAAVVQMGAVSLINGRVLFTDHFIKPNYTANLSALTGKLGAFTSQPVQGAVQLADLELRGRVEETASLEILGKLNPLAKPLALNINGKVRDLELPALSPYSVRYVGYGIERGKLSVDVNYVVLPDGQLTATNNIVLNQLTFGDEVPGAEHSLPVKLAVALLADSNGVIDLNLPVSGSLNDPQFSLGPVIFKILGNLIVKALTAPFSLLTHALGGGSNDLSTVPFALGSAALTPEARLSLDKVAKMLNDRPALKMTVVGSADLAAEHDALQRQRLQQLVLTEKRRNAASTGALSSKADADAVQGLTVGAVEYPALLKAIYKAATIPKPRNALGLLKDLPAPEMEQLLLANLTVSEENAQQLAVQRGVAVRDYLAAQKLPLERLFLGAAKTVAAAKEKDWRPAAELQLAMP